MPGPAGAGGGPRYSGWLWDRSRNRLEPLPVAWVSATHSLLEYLQVEKHSSRLALFLFFIKEMWSFSLA